MSPSCPHTVPGGSVGVENSVGSLVKAGMREVEDQNNKGLSFSGCVHVSYKCMHKLG